jgi:hypothetical protein
VFLAAVRIDQPAAWSDDVVERDVPAVRAAFWPE